MHSNRSRPILAFLVVLAGVAWSVAWGFNGQTAEGTTRVLGWTEGGWRAVLNPALVAVLAAAMAWSASRPRSVGALLVVAGFGAMLAGNLLEFGLLGVQTPAAGVGWVTFLAGAAAATVGLGLQIGRAAARTSGRARLGALAGTVTILGVVLMSVAAPAAASLALFPLMDALLQAPGESTASAPARTVVAASAVAQG